MFNVVSDFERSGVQVALEYPTWWRLFAKRFPGHAIEGSVHWMQYLRETLVSMIEQWPDHKGRQRKAFFLFTDHSGQAWEGSCIRKNDAARTVVLNLYPRLQIGGDDERRDRFNVYADVIMRFDGKRLQAQWELMADGGWSETLSQRSIIHEIDGCPVRVGAYVHQLYIRLRHAPESLLKRQINDGLQYLTRHYKPDAHLPNAMWNAKYMELTQSVQFMASHTNVGAVGESWQLPIRLKNQLTQLLEKVEDQKEMAALMDSSNPLGSRITNVRNVE